MKQHFMPKMAALAVAYALSHAAVAVPVGNDDLVRVRTLFFGAENVDQLTGAVDNKKVVFSWTTNATYAVSVKAGW